jgi:hypothetical protein
MVAFPAPMATAGLLQAAAVRDTAGTGSSFLAPGTISRAMSSAVGEWFTQTGPLR